MKKYLCFPVILILLLSSLCACAHRPDVPKGTSESDDSMQSTFPGKFTLPSDFTDPTIPAESVIPTEPTVPETEPIAVDTLSLDKEWYAHYEGAEDYTLLVTSEYSIVTMSECETGQYSNVARVLAALADRQRKTMEEELDNLISFARDEYAQDPYNFTAYVSTLDVQVRRADSIVISLLFDSYSDYIGIDGFRALSGSTFDSQTGEQLKLSDVVRDMDALPSLIEREMDEYILTVMLSLNTAVQDYFRDTPEDGIRWTLDYNGVTFYFVSGELTEPDGGSQQVTLTFEEYPELVYERYLNVPEEYTVELTNDATFFADLNEDGVCETLMFSAWLDRERNHYLDFGIYSNVDGMYYYEECYQYRFYPFYAKTKDGQYLYLYCEFVEEGYRDMNLKVFSLEMDSIEKLEEYYDVQVFTNTGAFQLPTDAERLNSHTK